MMLWWLACTGAPSPAPQAPVADDEPRGDVLVGVLHRGGTPACAPDDDEARWHGVHWLVGFTPLRLDDPALEATLQGHHGQLVSVRGQPSDQVLPAPPLPEGLSFEHCPVPQMRMDYVDGPDGIRIRRSVAGRPASFVAQAVEPFGALSATSVDGGLAVALANPFEEPLSKVFVRVHYEACTGKPGSASLEGLKPELAPGEAYDKTLPAVIMGPRSYPHRAYSVQAAGEAEGVLFDLDARLPELGLERVACPDAP